MALSLGPRAWAAFIFFLSKHVNYGGAAGPRVNAWWEMAAVSKRAVEGFNHGRVCVPRAGGLRLGWDRGQQGLRGHL